MEVEEVIEGYRQVVEQGITSAGAAKKKLDHLIELRKIKVKRLKGERLTDDEIQRIMNLLCWNSYAGCCAPAKNCPWNAAVSDALGVNYEELYEEKKKVVRKYLTRLASL